MSALSASNRRNSSAATRCLIMRLWLLRVVAMPMDALFISKDVHVLTDKGELLLQLCRQLGQRKRPPNLHSMSRS